MQTFPSSVSVKTSRLSWPSWKQENDVIRCQERFGDRHSLHTALNLRQRDMPALSRPRCGPKTTLKSTSSGLSGLLWGIQTKKPSIGYLLIFVPLLPESDAHFLVAVSVFR